MLKVVVGKSLCFISPVSQFLSCKAPRGVDSVSHHVGGQPLSEAYMQLCNYGTNCINNLSLMACLDITAVSILVS